MSHFYAEIQGHRGEATRTGNADIRGHIRGWHLGVKVIGYQAPDGGPDVFHVYVTGGSNGAEPDRLIAVLNEKEPHTLITSGEDIVRTPRDY